MDLIFINELKPHEETIKERLQEIKRKILNDKIIDFPIIVDKNTKTIYFLQKQQNIVIILKFTL